MSKLSEQITSWHKPMDNVAMRALTMSLGFVHVGLLMWEPHAYASAIGGFNTVIVIALIWAVCSSMVYGIGFKPRSWYWQLFFSAYFSLSILLYFTLQYTVT